MIANLLERVSALLQDGLLDEEESKELLALLQRINGDQSEIGELAKTTGLPLDDPPPGISFPQHTFLFTGTFVYGTRKQCQAAVESLGALNASSVTKGLNYLVLGTYVTDSWAHETYGRKIEKAMSYRSDGVPIAIVSESHWITCGGL